MILNFAGLNLLCTSNLDEMDLKGARRNICNLICKRSEFLAVRYNLEHLAIELIQELMNFGCLGDLGS